jgi:hypothetical protein
VLPSDAIPVDISDIDDGWYMFDPMVPAPTLDQTVQFPSFREYLQELPDHQSLLLQRYEICCESIYDVCAKLQSLSGVILVSDGGALDDCGSYGWVISLSDGTRLARGSGSVFGYDPRSYRAEGHGAKAGTLFMIHCFKYCDLPIPAGQFRFYCDNEGLIKKLEYLRSYKNAIQATVLHSEWDIVSSVHRLQCSFPSPLEILHVKGHQDDDTPEIFLELPGQLNVEADRLATNELNEYSSCKPMVPFDPEAGVQLNIAGKTITHNLAASIHNQQHLPSLRHYYRHRFTWTLFTFDDIDWPSFAMVYTKFPRHRTFYSKFG